MSINFSANQYENAFKTLKNWEVPKGFGRYPSSRDGFTEIVATDRGHLLGTVPRSRVSPWGKFVGTWDMPTRIPGNSITNGTARSELALEKLERMKTDGEIILRGQLKKCKVPPPMKVRGDGSAIEAAFGNTAPKPATPKTPKSATGRLSGAGEPEDSGLRSGAKNPIPISRVSPKSVDWPRPGASRLEKPMTPARLTPPGSRNERIQTPDKVNSAENMAAASAANMVPGSPEPELQQLTRIPSPAEPVAWPMPKSTEPYEA